MVGFQTMVIMDLWGMFYHPVVVGARIFVLLLNFISAYCGYELQFLKRVTVSGTSLDLNFYLRVISRFFFAMGHRLLS